MDDYEKYEAACQKIRRANKKLLTDFESWLESSGLSEKTIKNHLANIDFYKEEMTEWLETMERYNDPSIEDMADVWGF